MKQVFGTMSAMKRKIPYGIMNWAEVVRECYFAARGPSEWQVT